MDYFFTASSENSRLLHINYFVFKRHKVRNGKEYWSCEERCGATCISNNDVIENLNNEHSHPPNINKSKKLKYVDKMKGILDQNQEISLRTAYDNIMAELRRGSDEEREIAG